MFGKFRGNIPLIIIIVAIVGIGLLAVQGKSQVLGLELSTFAQVVALVAMVLWLIPGLFNRMRFNQLLNSVMIWLVLGFGLFALHTYRYDAMAIVSRIGSALFPSSPTIQTNSEGRQAVIFNRAINDHFTVKAKVNQQTINFLFDTGASTTTLSARDARIVGIDLNVISYTKIISTANGRTTAGSATIDQLTIGSITRRNFKVLVTKTGQLDISLLGMNFLQTLSGFQVIGDRLELYP